MTAIAPPEAAQLPLRTVPKPKPFERTILAGLARGRSARVMAAELDSTYEAVRTSIATMRHRYRVRDSAALVKAAYDRGHLDDLLPEPKRYARVTERMRQVLHGMALGRTDAEISRGLFLLPNTVKSHVRRVLRELDAVNRAHAVALDCQHHYSAPVMPEYRRRVAR